MAANVFYVGDELGAAGYRLAGVQVLVPDAGGETDALEQACTQGWLVLLCAAVARRVDAEALRRASAALTPLVLVVPDMQGQVPIGDLADRLRAQLGLVG